MVAHQATVPKALDQAIDVVPAAVLLEREDGAVEVDVGFRQHRLDITQARDLHARRADQRGLHGPWHRNLRQRGAGHEERHEKGVNNNQAHSAFSLAPHMAP